MMFSFFDAVDWGNARLQDAASFLRSIPSLLAPKPSPASNPYTPPFLDGQCVGVIYNIFVNVRDGDTGVGTSFVQVAGAIRSFSKRMQPNGTGQIVIVGNQNNEVLIGTGVSFATLNWSIQSLTRQDGLAISCGNVPNPNPSSPSINDDGLFQPNNPVIGDENGAVNPAAIVLSPAAPLILIGGGLAAAAAAAAAAQAASDALQAIKKVAESLDALKKLWEKLQEFLEEWEKDRPKNRDIVRQTYGSIEGDGAIDFYPLSNKNFAAIQVDIVVTEVPLGFGKYFGSMSPSRYRYKELGYISFYSINKGIIETHSIQFKRSSLAIPKTAVGFIYHFGLDNKIKGFAFGTFSVRKT